MIKMLDCLPVYKSAPAVLGLSGLVTQLVRLHDNFDIEAERAETVVAADHRAHGVLHPAVIEIASAFGQGLHELLHRRPGGRTHPFGALSVDGNPLLALSYVAGVFDGVLVLLHQVCIDGLPNGCDSNFVHCINYLRSNPSMPGWR